MSKLLKKSKSKKSKAPKAPKAPEPPQEPWHRVGRGEPVAAVDIPGIERLLEGQRIGSAQHSDRAAGCVRHRAARGEFRRTRSREKRRLYESAGGALEACDSLLRCP